MNQLKMNDRTLNILKNFSSINQSIVFRPGKTIATISPGKKIYAKANIEDEISDEFAIYELPRLFGVLALIPEYKIEIDDQKLCISSDKESRSINYGFADPEHIMQPPVNGISMTKTDVSFVLTNKALSAAMKAASVLGMPEIAITGDGENIFIETSNSAKPSNDIYRDNIGEFEGSKKRFKMIFKVENLKMLPDDYKVKISFKKLAQFVSKDVEYFIVVEKNSTVD